MAYGCRVIRAAIDRREYSPDRIMQIARLQYGGQSLGIGHRGEVAVVGRADPARARSVGAKFVRRVAAGHRLRRALPQAGLEGLTLGRKTLPIEDGIFFAARARAMRGKSRLVRIHEGHAFGRRISTVAAVLAARERLDSRQELLRDEVRGLT